MTPGAHAGRRRSGLRRAAALAAVAVAGLGALGGLRFLRAEAVPVLMPVYSIETVSNGRQNGLVGLTMGQPGVPQVPTPVDVDGDLLPDIIVAVNLVDVSALVQNPPSPGAVLAPNIEIARDPTAVVRCLPGTPLAQLSNCSPPVKVQVKLTVKDSDNLKKDTVVRFGYDTGNNGSSPKCPAATCDPLARSGSIPPYFKAVVTGLDTFFNPVTAAVSTRGIALVGQTTNNIDVARVTNGYEGPLDLVGSIGTADGILADGGILKNVLNPGEEISSDLRFGYRPWPGEVKVSYGTDDAGKHVKYEHERKDEVDLDTRIVNVDRDNNRIDTSVIEARVDRLPRRIELDFDAGNRAGNLRYRARADGRLPDVTVKALSEKLQAMTKTQANAVLDLKARLEARVGALSTTANASLFLGLGEEQVDVALVPREEPLLAEVDVEGLPPTIGADWAFPTGGGPASALFCAGPIAGGACAPAAQGIGAVEGTVRNYYGNPTALTPFVPEQQQTMSFQTAPGGPFGRESLIRGRVERIRSLSFAQSPAGFNAAASAGDGELPLQLFFSADERSAGKPLVQADATIVPLPDAITAAFDQPGEDQKADPLELTYTSSKSVDVNSHVEVREPAAGPVCGNKGTICGDLRVRHLPAKITARVGAFPASSDLAPSSTKFAETRVAIDAEPRPGGARPDFFADLALGQDDGIPLIAHAELLGFPEHTSIRAREGLDNTLDRVEFHACERLFDTSPPSCRSGTEQEIGALSFNVHNWFARPPALPILNPTTPLYATVAVRGRDNTSDIVDFEATGKVSKISRLMYRNTQKIFGVSSKIGGGKALSALVDVGNLDVQDDNPANGRLDITGETTINPLPATMDFCVRHIGQTLQSLSDDFTDPCENPEPFADLGETAPVAKTPLSVAYRAASPFDVSAKASLLQRGLSAGRSDDHLVKGSLDVVNVPSDMTLHFDSPPKDVKGPIKGVFEAKPGAAVNADFSFESTDADLVCQDPRRPALEKKALCAAGRIENLPTKARFRYDPTVKVDNLLVETDTSINLKKLALSSVEGVRKSDDAASPDFAVIVPKVLVAEGEINGLPKQVKGTLDLPKDKADGPTVEIRANPPVGEVKVTARNFIAPDPFIKPVPNRATAFPAPTQTVFFRQQGDLFKAEANIKSVKSAGYRTVKDAAGKALDTKVVSVDFGTNQVIRAYADILKDPSAHTIADVTLNDVPAGLSLCFRGKKEATTAPGAGQATYCDVGDTRIPVGDADGSFQFIGTPGTPDASPLDVDAFVRHAGGGGSDILSGRIQIDNIPFVVEGTFPTSAEAGSLDVGGFKRSGSDLVPDGIDRIEANVATFDLKPAGPSESGYGADRPFEPKPVNISPFPVTATANQHLKAAVKDGEAQIRARIGPQSQVQRVRMLRSACAAPSNEPPDYPFFPADGSKYTCVSGVFDPSAANDPLDLAVHMEKGGSLISVADAGLSDIPGRFQLTLSDTKQLDDSVTGEPLRRRCGTASGPGAEPAGTTNCMPPLVRFDQPSQSVLFGTVRAGTAADLKLLDPGTPGAIVPREKLADLDAVPTAGGYPGWGSSPTCQANPDTCGVRAKIVSFKGDRTAVKAGIRIGVPQSLTVDQIQSWSDSDKNGKPEYWEASDTRFHYAVRDSNGFAVGKLGQLAAMKHSDDGTQILVSSPCTSRPLFRDDSTNPVRTTADECPDFLNGIAIPGEIGLDIYQRNHTGDGKDFTQVDGRLSNPGSAVNLGVRVLGGGPKPAIGRLEGEVLNVPTVGPGVNAGDPSFRLRVEMLGDGEAPPTGPPSAPAAGGGKECSPFFCIKTDVRIKSVLASFNFLSARRVEATVRQGGATKQGMEVKAFTGVRDANGGGTLTPITAKAFLDINPINVYMRAGIPLLGGADFVLESQLHAAVGLEQVKRFTLRHNTLHVKASTEADAAAPDSRIGPINFYIYRLHGSAYGLFIKLFGIDFAPTSLAPSANMPPGPPKGPVRLRFIDCNNALSFFPGVDTSLGTNTLRIQPNGSRNAVLWPFDPILEPRVHFSGLFGSAAKLVSAVAGPFFCLTGADPSDIPLPSPGDPVGPTPTATSTRAVGHPVPDATVEASSFTPPVQPDVNPPDFTVTGTLSLCGSHLFSVLTVNGTLQVANAASATDITGTGANCPAGEEGGLTLIADTVNVGGAGRIRADGTNPAIQADGTPPTGRSGGGHGGPGGAAAGTAGGTYGDTTINPVTEVGGRGAGAEPGAGGGAVVVRAKDVNVAGGGEISARGGFGGSGAADCATPVVSAGSGGGSGGGIAIAAVKVDNNGTITARGGNGGSGGAGGGGGGGGGIVKVVSPLFTGNSASAGGGNPGAGFCGSAGGGGGTARTPITNGTPQSLPDSPANGKFWQRDSAASDLAIPVSAAASGGTAKGMEVYLCGRYRTPAQVAAAQDASPAPPDLNSVFTMPVFGPTQIISPITGTAVVAPCGSDSPFFATDSQLGSTLVNADRFNGTIATTGSLADGYHGFWTVVMRRPSSGASCLNPVNFVSCVKEVNPEKVDLVLGVDNAAPSINITAPASGFETRAGQIKLVVDADDQADLSMLDKVECSNDGTSFFACAAGENSWPLAPGPDGPRTITARSTDVAGNSSVFSVTGLLDTTVPLSLATFTGGVQGGDNWYRVPPAVNLFGADSGSGLADPAFAFRFDSGSENPCPAPSPCPVPAAQVGSLITGEHTLSFTAVDEAGNRLFDDEDAATPGPMNSRRLKLDPETPLSAFLTVPGGVDGATPNGANGWFTVRPLVTFSAVDQPGASGLVGTDAGIFYTVESNGVLGPLTKFDGVPFALAPGLHNVCWYSADLAGNQEGTRCRGPIKVDDAAPEITIVTAPAAPDGANGWYVTKPVVRIVATDAVPGSGITAATSPSGVFVSLDGSSFGPYNGAPITIAEGLHEVRAFTVDVSGQKSPIRAASYMVDLSKPVTSIRVRPPDPARAGWWRRVPNVVLRSTDGEGNAGVGKTQDKLDGGAFEDYTGAFPVPSGAHTVTYRALDRSGPANQEPDRSLAVPVDVTAPVVRATTPEPVIWLRTLLGPKNAKLKWTVAEDLGKEIRVVVIVYDATGQPVRRIVDGTRTVTPAAPAQTFETLWDGKDDSLLGNAPIGIYYYRVIVIDEAGNASMSGESTPLNIKI
ncbi:MAG: hypothetical protein ACR2MO_08295 [Acidimicrobiales bacterium]